MLITSYYMDIQVHEEVLCNISEYSYVTLFQGTILIDLQRNDLILRVSKALIKADTKSYILLETAAIFFLANLILKQSISSEYVMINFICMG